MCSERCRRVDVQAYETRLMKEPGTQLIPGAAVLSSEHALLLLIGDFRCPQSAKRISQHACLESDVAFNSTSTMYFWTTSAHVALIWGQ